MKLSIYCITLVMWVLSLTYSNAQETDTTKQIQVLEATKERVVNEEKEALKTAVENINDQLENGKITPAEAEEKKQQAAEKHALNIENRLAIITNKIAFLERNQEVGVPDDEGRFVFTLDTGENDVPFIFVGKTGKKRKYDRRTSSDFVFAVGLNNVITEGESLEDSDFKIGGSRFAEIGWAWKTRVFKESNWLRIKYGLSFQFNGLKPTDNRYYVDTGEQTVLMEHPLDLDKSKFRMDNLVVPVHFEIGPSKKVEKEDYFRYSTHNQVKLGFGGYGGLRLATRQKLKYETDGQDIKEKQKASFNTNNFVYGLSAYLGWRATAVYVKYDLNTIFKDNIAEQRNISLGLRFDMD